MAFGALMLFSTVRFLANGWAADLYLDPQWMFPFEGFEWLPRPKFTGVVLLFGGLLIGSLSMLLGAWYRFGAALFFVCFTYVELLDKSNYLNHYYFVSLMALVLACLPAHRVASVDALRGFRGFRRPSAESDRSVGVATEVPAWMLDLPKLMLSLVYFFAGVAKLNADWMFDALPLRMWLPPHADYALIGPLFETQWMAYAFSWGGAFFDLTVGILLWRTRWLKWVYPIIVVFHLMTWSLFPIGVFPWVMMVATLVFFPADFHRRILGWVWPERAMVPDRGKAVSIRNRRFSRGIVVIFLIFQVAFPLRHMAYNGSVYWHESGYRFSWRVMMMEKAGTVMFFARDAEGREREANGVAPLTMNQWKMVSTQPDMLVQCAQLIRDSLERAGVAGPVQVRAEVFASLNGRGSQLFLRPFLDLTAMENGWGERDWVLPLDSVVTYREFMSRREALRTSAGW